MRTHFFYLFLGLSAAAISCSSPTSENTSTALLPPDAAQVPTETLLHGISLRDDYAWLKDKSNPDVIAYLEAENAYTDTLMSSQKELINSLFEEMKGRIKEEDQSAPIKIDDYYYYNRSVSGKQYRVYCRKKGSMEAPEEVLLDLNQLAEGKKFLSMGNYSISPNHQYMAYTLDSTGAEVFDLYVKELASGQLLEDVIPNVSYSLVWGQDNQTLFYSINDETNRPYKIFKHKLGVSYMEDMQVFHEEDDRYFVSISQSKDRQYLLIDNHSKITSETYYLPVNDPNGEFTLFSPRVDGVEYTVYPYRNKFFILTNDGAINYRLMECSGAQTSRSNWKEVIAGRDSVKIEGLELFANHLVLSERSQGLRQIKVMNLANRTSYYVPFPDPMYNVSLGGNVNYTSSKLRITYSSLVWPEKVYEFDMNSQATQDIKVEEVPGYDPAQYQSERIYATASDGTRIPISLLYKKGMEKNGQNPTYLYGYGSYGSITNTSFNTSRISLLDRGFIYAVAHIRGSGDLGEQWYQEGKFTKKKNTFTDFIACAEHLAAENYTKAEKIVAVGGSAGGLLMGAVANMKPEAFGVIVAKVPFVDVMNTMLDPNLPLTVTEYEEWGNPNEKEYFEYMLSYSPYDNVSAQDYPHMLVTAGLNDPRVGYWEAAKWVAKLRDLKTDNKELLFKINMGAGHMGASGRYNYLKETAFEYAFILDKINPQIQ
ncbi:S9 family peptidase [Cytophagales bacterium LB-30]|uniref:S9 family peptidase n=1 Tax=Shiella aurantiaca TaxID=3058365 RepID=A0ABT8F1L0_9BACT|nr:S9 family peptidase [Shiella aurantiaca]MDN4164340.1 S9 family peptidase [Shiella aurantiaca]